MSTPTTTFTSASPTATGPNGCITAVPGPNGEVPYDACNSYYNYPPSFAPAVATAVIFGILTAVHVVEAIAYRKLFAWTVIMSASWETVAFILLALGSHNQQKTGFASGYSTLFLLAPVWLNAFVYMSFSRMLFFFRPQGRPSVFKVPAAWISFIFVMADVGTFLVQATGGVMTNPENDDHTAEIGLKIYEWGIGIQEGFIVIFTVLIIRFQRRQMEEDRVKPWHDPEVPTHPRRGSWKATLYAMYAVLACITTRIVFRLVEFSGGFDPKENPIPFTEAYIYALDATPMMIGLIISAIWHPGRILHGPNSEFPRKTRAQKRAEKKARKQAKKDAKDDKKRRKEDRKARRQGKQSQYEQPEGYTMLRMDGTSSR